MLRTSPTRTRVPSSSEDAEESITSVPSGLGFAFPNEHLYKYPFGLPYKVSHGAHSAGWLHEHAVHKHAAYVSSATVSDTFTVPAVPTAFSIPTHLPFS